VDQPGVVVLQMLLVKRLDGTRRLVMDRAAPLGQYRVVGDLLRQRMLEGVLGTSQARLLVDELAHLQVHQYRLELLLLFARDDLD
jgi:hypothetical protein